MKFEDLLSECTAYDFKVALEEKKPKSWLKSVSVPATAEQMLRLVLKGANKTFDSLETAYKAEDYSFNILANTFRTRA